MVSQTAGTLNSSDSFITDMPSPYLKKGRKQEMSLLLKNVPNEADNIVNSLNPNPEFY